MTWKKKALQNCNIRGEHAYLQAIKDFKKALLKEFEDINTHDESFHDKISFIIKNCKP